MSHRAALSSLSLSVTALASVLACGAPAALAPVASDGDSPAAEEASEEEPGPFLLSHEWVSAELLLLRGWPPDRTWLMERQTGRSVEVTCFGKYVSPQASPDGQRLMTLSPDSSTLAVARVQDVLAGACRVSSASVPPFPEHAERDISEREHDHTNAFWLNDGRLMVVRTSDAPDYQQCYLFGSDASSATPLGNCFDPVWLYTEVTFVGLGDDRYALDGSNEGVGWLEILRFTPEAGPTVLADLTHDFNGVVDAYRDPATDTFYLASRAPLKPDGSYSGPSEVPPGPKRLYRRAADGSFVATGEELPRGARLRSIASGERVWVDERGKLCTRTAAGPPLCHALPAELKIEH